MYCVTQIDEEDKENAKNQPKPLIPHSDPKIPKEPAAVALKSTPQQALQALHALLTAIDDGDDEAFSNVLSQMQHKGGYDVWMNKDNAQLVAVPPLHCVVSKGSTHLLKQCVCTLHTVLWHILHGDSIRLLCGT